jgi:DNA-binding CsgD family transcriptional regulator
MNAREKVLIILIQLVVAVLVAADVLDDLRNGAADWHLVLEILIGFMAFGGIVYLLLGTYRLRRSLQELKVQSESTLKSAEDWRERSRKYSEGLSQEIDDQLSKWQLTPAEKEVALLLLKGLSVKEIADLRNTAERTVRVQAIAVYSKSGLSGRTALSAFFLEDLLAPVPKSL